MLLRISRATKPKVASVFYYIHQPKRQTMYIKLDNGGQTVAVS